jgi:hypothetical protein
VYAFSSGSKHDVTQNAGAIPNSDIGFESDGIKLTIGIEWSSNGQKNAAQIGKRLGGAGRFGLGELVFQAGRLYSADLLSSNEPSIREHHKLPHSR